LVIPFEVEDTMGCRYDGGNNSQQTTDKHAEEKKLIS